MKTETDRRQAARQRIFNQTAPLHDWHVRSWEGHCWNLLWSVDPEDWTDQDRHDVAAYDKWRKNRKPKDDD